MEITKPKINVRKFSRSKVNSEDKPIEEPVVEKKTRGRKKKVIIEEPIIEEPIIEEPIIIGEEYIPESFELDDNFLQELNFSNYQKELDEEQNREANLKQQKELEKERIKQEKEQEKYLKQLEKDKVRTNKAKVSSDSDLYSDTPTEINGKEKLILLHKIKQYKVLFEDELKTFKIKPNSSINELKQYIDEMDVIVSTSNVDQFITDSILQCIKLIEMPTSRTKSYNISGLSDLLRSNKQFHQLCKKLYLKYG
jgi:hypothetical protein